MSKARMNQLMLGETDKVAKETEEILRNAFKRFNIPIIEDLGTDPSITSVAEESTEKMTEEVMNTGEKTAKDLESSAPKEVAHEQTNISPLDLKKKK